MVLGAPSPSTIPSYVDRPVLLLSIDLFVQMSLETFD